MKKLIALLAVLGFAGTANAADGADFSHSGEFRLQYQNDANADWDDSADDTDQDWNQRLRWGTTVRAGEKLTGHFTLVHNAAWGSNADQTPDDISIPAGTDAAGGAAGTNNILIVNEAYASWMVNDSWSLRFGRGSFTMADGRFVSANDFNAVSKAFDGGMASWDQEWARWSFFAVEGAKGLVSPNTMGLFFGFAADFKSLPSFLKSANLHVVQVKRDADDYNVGGTVLTLPDQDNLKVGFVVTGEAGAADWRVNYETESGDNGNGAQDISTSMYDLEAGYKLGWNDTRIHLGYHSDSGSTGADDETYDGFHYDTHANAGLMDVLGWGNLTYMRAGATISPKEGLTVGLEYLAFTMTEEDQGSYQNVGALGTTASVAGEDDLGTEIDVWVSKKYTNNFSITGRYSTFAPGEAIVADGDDRTQVYVESKLTF
jgi:Alginate export